MKTLVISLATVCLLVTSSTASAAIRVRVGSVSVAVGRRAPRAVRPVHVAPLAIRPVHAAPRPARAAVVHTRRTAVHQIAGERRDAFQEIVEERHDTVQDTREERVDRARDVIRVRRQLWEMIQAQQP